MPEMPELEVLRGFLAPRLRERLISDVSISPRFGFLLRTPVDELRARLTGETINGISRRGKFLLLDLASNRLVINPMLGGRLHWQPAAAKPPPNAIFGIELDDGNRLHLSDFARMARVYLVAAGQ